MTRTVLPFFLSLAAFAAAPPLREQVLLNGTWDQGAVVPIYEGTPNFDRQTYERSVEVPASWTGKTIQVEFENVAFIADVFIDGKHVLHHVGAWNPFAVEITALVKPGARFRLRVDVKGPKHSPVDDGKGRPLWPVGGWYQRSIGGICGDVFLRAYGPVRIEDAFIQPSCRANRLVVDYTVRNSTAQARTVRVEAETGPGRKFASPPAALKPGETRTVRAVLDKPALELWWPDRPVLHNLRSRIVENGRTLDLETRRFGFREIWIDGAQFCINGVRANLFGDYQVFGDTWYTQPVIYRPENWPATVDRIKAMNIRILRWHHNPVPQYVLDVADEKGLLICDEAANYARSFMKGNDQAEYLRNALTWTEAWVKADRNHPSIYMWNATNEMTYPFCGPFKAADLLELGEAISKLDPTRPVGYDGDSPPVPAALVDYHYPEGYNREPIGSIYGWAHLAQSDRPTGSGELLHTRSPLKEVQTAVERNIWWLGVWLRGLRYSNWTNVKPACFWFTDKDRYALAAVNLRNAYAPVALFDKEYDDLGLSPYLTGVEPGGTPPLIHGGVKANRTLILYNDEFRDSAVTAEVELVHDGSSVARATRAFSVEPGEHLDIPCSFDVPNRSGVLDLVLRTYKGGARKFEETRRFKVATHGEPLPGAVTIRLGP